MSTETVGRVVRNAFFFAALIASGCNTFVRVPENPEIAARPEHTAPLTTSELLRFSLENLGEVEPGLLYRSDQPSVGILEFLDERANLRYIVTLRGKPEQYAKDFAESHGAEIIGLRMSAGRPPAPRQVLELIRVTHRAQREGGSILIHCAAGADRTGMAVALWRMLFQNETDRDKLIDETIFFRHFPPAYPNVHRFIEVVKPELYLPFVENPALLDDEKRITELESHFFRNYPLESGIDRVTSGPLRAGVAKRDLLDGWNAPIQMATYGPAPGVAKGIRDAVYARALTLDNGATRVSIVTCDLLIMNAALRAEVLRRLDEGDTGVTDVLLAATHTHTSVGAYVDHWGFEFYMIGKFDQRMLDHLASTIVSTIIESIDDLRDARIGSGQTMAEGINFDRRLDTQVDTSVGLLKIETLDRKPLATVVNFSGHPILAPADGLISSDYPGLLTRRLDEHHGFGIFLGGAIGDVNANAPGHVDEFATEGFMELVASELLRVVENALPSIETRREIELASMTTLIDLPDTNVNILPDLFFPLEWLLVELMEWPTRHPLQALRIGDTSIVGSASEITNLLGLEIKDRSPAPRTFVVTHANGYAGYAIKRVHHSKSKLDAASAVALNGAGHGSVIVESALQLAAEQWDEKPLPAAPPADAWSDPTMPQSRRVTTLVDDGFPYHLRAWLVGVYLDQIRGGNRAEGHLRDVTAGVAVGLPEDVRADLEVGHRRSAWRSAAGPGRDEGAKDLVVGVERPFRVFQSEIDGDALRLIPRVETSLPTGNANTRAPFAFASGAGVWRPAFGGAAELTWDTYRNVVLETLYHTSIDDHRGRRPGDRWEGGLWYTERHGFASFRLGATAAMQLADRRSGGRRAVDVDEISFEVDLRPGLSLRFGERTELFVEGSLPIGHSGSGAGAGQGVLAGVLVEF